MVFFFPIILKNCLSFDLLNNKLDTICYKLLSQTTTQTMIGVIFLLSKKCLETHKKRTTQIIVKPLLISLHSESKKKKFHYIFNKCMLI